MVVFSAVEERDLRSRNNDACRVRLGRWTTIVMCIGREPEGGQSAAFDCFAGPVGQAMRHGGRGGGVCVSRVWRHEGEGV